MQSCRIAATPIRAPSVSCFCRYSRTTLKPRLFSTVLPSDTSTSRSSLLTLLHKTTELLPRVLPQSASENIPFEQSLRLWNDVLSDTYNNVVSNTRDVPLNITGQYLSPFRVCLDQYLRSVLELDQWSGARDLVTGLLQEPFASDTSRNDLISQRWNNVPPGQTSLAILYVKINLLNDCDRNFDTGVETLRRVNPTFSLASRLISINTLRVYRYRNFHSSTLLSLSNF